ncbi:MAG: hydroxymethylbilane synthase [Chloroflexi bacterium]|nr:hydroxymethylbilane synthase [Chloroflexota bacterium]
MANRTSKIVVGTRGSALAQWQARFVIAALQRVAPDLEIELRTIKTAGDQEPARPLAEIGGLGAFTKQIEDALLAHEIDLAVHSLKDLPTEIAHGLIIAAIPEREDARDCLVSRHGVGLMQLPRGARIGTSSARRAAQVLALRPDAQIVPVRGNVDTRLHKAQSEDYDAIVLAVAGVTRLGRAREITEYLSLDQVLPDPGQGALAVQVRAADTALATVVAQFDHAPTRAAVTAERAFLRALGGGCRMPIGAYAQVRDGQLYLRGVIADADGSRVARGEIVGKPNEAETLGAHLAAQLTRPSAASPLRGKRILITRAREQATAFADKIRALGGEPVEYPAIEFASPSDFAQLDRALAAANDFDWVVFTSVNGVRFVAERMRSLGLSPRAFESAKLAAIGPATARALQDLGLTVGFVPTKFLGEQIAVELPIVRGQRALLLRADLASDVLAEKLAERGVAVMDVDAYRTVLPTAGNVKLGKVDAITFTSSSTVRNLTEMLDGKIGDLGRAAVFCIGPVTAETARALGWRVDAVASEHTVDGLVAAMVRFYQRTSNYA